MVDDSSQRQILVYLHSVRVPVTTYLLSCVCNVIYDIQIYVLYICIHIFVCLCVYVCVCVCVCVRTSFHRPVRTSPEGKNRDPTPSFSPSLQLPEYVIFVSLEVNLPLPLDNRKK